MATPSDPTPTSVYRYYDSAGILIYVGITKQGIGRNVQHNGTKGWWQFVASQQVDHCETRPDAQAREIELIQRHRPPFNRQHNPEFATMNAAYLAFQERMVGFVPTPGGTLRREYCKFLVDVVGQCEDGMIALRSRVVDTIATSRLRHVSGVPVIGGGRRVGGVCEITHQGPLVVIIFNLRAGNWLFDAVEVSVKPIGGTYPVDYQLRNVSLLGYRRDDDAADEAGI
jgi:hypothetical protein